MLFLKTFRTREVNHRRNNQCINKCKEVEEWMLLNKGIICKHKEDFQINNSSLVILNFKAGTRNRTSIKEEINHISHQEISNLTKWIWICQWIVQVSHNTNKDQRIRAFLITHLIIRTSSNTSHSIKLSQQNLSVNHLHCRKDLFQHFCNKINYKAIISSAILTWTSHKVILAHFYLLKEWVLSLH